MSDGLTDDEKEIILSSLKCLEALNQLGWLEDINKRLVNTNKYLEEIVEEIAQIKERLV